MMRGHVIMMEVKRLTHESANVSLGLKVQQYMYNPESKTQNATL